MKQGLQLLSMTNLAGSNSAGREEMLGNIITSVENGDVDIMKLHTHVKKAEQMIKSLLDHPVYKSHLLDAVQKVEKGYELNYTSFETRETGVKYDYAVCGDPVLAGLQQQKDELDKKIKKRETYVKAIPSAGVTTVIEETGEVMTLYPPNKMSATAVVATLL